MKNGESIDEFVMKLTTIVTDIRSLGTRWRRYSSSRSFFELFSQDSCRLLPPLKQYNDLKNMSVEVIGRLKSHKKRLCGYDDREEEKHLLLKYEKWLAWMKRKDVVDSFFLGKKEHGSHNKESKGRGHGCGHDCECGGRGGRDNYLVNPWQCINRILEC